MERAEVEADNSASSPLILLLAHDGLPIHPPRHRALGRPEDTGLAYLASVPPVCYRAGTAQVGLPSLVGVGDLVARVEYLYPGGRFNGATEQVLHLRAL